MKILINIYLELEEKGTERLLLGRRVLRIDRDALETTAGWKKTLDKLRRLW
jgi:hypothetical protein